MTTERERHSSFFVFNFFLLNFKLTLVEFFCELLAFFFLLQNKCVNTPPPSYSLNQARA